MLSEVDTAPLYANYGRTSNDEIRKLLERIKLINFPSDSGVKNMNLSASDALRISMGWFTLGPKTFKKVMKSPRNFSYPFEWGINDGEFIEGKRLKAFKALPFLVKSSSYLMLKPDIGEVIDQMTEEDKEMTDAIYISLQSNHRLNTPSLDEFIVESTLYKFVDAPNS